MPATSTRPRSIVQWDTTLKTNTRRVYGYQPYCACGWEGKVWRTHHESQAERSFHTCEPRLPETDPYEELGEGKRRYPDGSVWRVTLDKAERIG